MYYHCSLGGCNIFATSSARSDPILDLPPWFKRAITFWGIPSFMPMSSQVRPVIYEVFLVIYGGLR